MVQAGAKGSRANDKGVDKEAGLRCGIQGGGLPSGGMAVVGPRETFHEDEKVSSQGVETHHACPTGAFSEQPVVCGTLVGLRHDVCGPT